MSDFYPLATGHMAKVWAKCVCPICDSDLESVGDEREDDDTLGELMLDNLFLRLLPPACDLC
jgi:hypothetical protein